MDETPIERAVRLANGQAPLARAIGVSQQRVWNWLNRDQRVPPECCKRIELATGVRASELRPDVFGSSAVDGAMQASEAT